MKIRIRFTKNDRIKYLGHLDIMRAFQKCMNRANIKMVYSEGFNPHQKMSFALPLSVGMTSTAEYLDAEVADGQDIQWIKKKLQEVSGPGFDILSVKILKEGAVKAMAAVQYADFEAVTKDRAFSEEEIGRFLKQDQILCTKKTKKGEKEEDIRPMIIVLKPTGTGLFMRLKAGSEQNLKVSTLLESLYAFCGSSYKPDRNAVSRKELMGKDFIPLESLDTDI